VFVYRFFPLTWLLGLTCLRIALSAGEFREASPRLGTRPAVSVDSVGTLRVMSWNVKAGALFPPGMPTPELGVAGARVGRFGRILRAIRPDVLCLQEIWPRREQRALEELMNRELPLADGAKWNLHRAVDVVIATRFRISSPRSEAVIHHPLPEMPDFHYGQAMGVVEVPMAGGEQPVFVVSTHFRSRSGAANIAMRERHANSVVDWIEDAKSPGGKVDIPDRTPFLIVGDLNVYESNEDDPLQHLKTLVTGKDPSGERGIDWDNTPLLDVLPSINGVGEHHYTWRNDGLPFAPGALDRFLVSDSVVGVADRFVLDVESLAEEQRERFGLELGDTLLHGQVGVYDHLPLVVDLVLSKKGDRTPEQDELP
jgi:endonuclease/exonuclease/phosphatase family metal-dependent hydrolase